eukprot:tig00021352_g20687.t1
MARFERPIHGRSEALQWLNGLLDADYIKIEQLQDGIAFCEILNMLHPKAVPLSRLLYTARTPEENLQNLRLLDTAMRRLDLRPVPLQALSKGQFAACIEFLTYFRSYYEKFHGAGAAPTGLGVFEQRKKRAMGADARGSGQQGGLSSHLLPNKVEAIGLLPKQKSSPPFPTRSQAVAPKLALADVESLRSYSGSQVASSPGRPPSALGGHAPAPEASTARSLPSSAAGAPSSGASLDAPEAAPAPAPAPAPEREGGGAGASRQHEEFAEMANLIALLKSEMRERLEAHGRTREVLGALASECEAYLERLAAIEGLCAAHPASPLAQRLLELVLQGSAPYQELPA